MSKLRLLLAATLTASLLAVGSAGAFAQSDESVAPAAGINADRVDGKHAVGYKASPSKRANKLVATDPQGSLPSNILKPLWELLQNVPAAFADGQISFSELIGTPAGFADGVDNGIVGMTVQQVVGPATNIVAGGNTAVAVDCPATARPISGGHTASNFLVAFVTSFRQGNGWIVAAHNNAAVAATVTPIVYCLTTNPAGGFNIAKKADKGVRPATDKKPPAPRRK